MFEAPHRLTEHLQQACQLWPQRRLVIFRELSKKYEEVLFRTTMEHLQSLEGKKLKGELVLMYEPIAPSLSPLSLDQSFGYSGINELEREIRNLLKQNSSTTDILKAISGKSSLKRKPLYQLIETLKSQLGQDKNDGET